MKRQRTTNNALNFEDVKGRFLFRFPNEFIAVETKAYKNPRCQGREAFILPLTVRFLCAIYILR